MATIKKPSVDAVLVGFGWTGAITGMELTEAGLKVLATASAVPACTGMASTGACCPKNCA